MDLIDQGLEAGGSGDPFDFGTIVEKLLMDPQATMTVGLGSHLGSTTEVPPSDFCRVCGDRASGRHYNVISCEGCKGFFKRSIRKQLSFACRALWNCQVTKGTRNRCQYCRLQKCRQVGMRKSMVQQERQPIGSNRKRLNTAGIYYDNSCPRTLDFSRYNPQKFQHFGKSDGDDSGSTGDNGKRIAVSPGGTISELHPTTAEKEGDGISSVFDGIDIDNILPDGSAEFSLVSLGPTPGDSALDAKDVGETASRLLFCSMRWTLSLPSFQALTFEMQILVAKSAWIELFAIGLAQCQTALSLPEVLIALLVDMQADCSSARLASMVEYVSKLSIFIWNAKECIGMDDFEFAALKALTLFSPERLAQLGDTVAFSANKIQTLIIDRLQNHILSHSDALEEPNARRLNKILLLLPQSRALNSGAMEELFFANLLGSIHIDALIPNILKVESLSFGD